MTVSLHVHLLLLLSFYILPFVAWLMLYGYTRQDVCMGFCLVNENNPQPIKRIQITKTTPKTKHKYGQTQTSQKCECAQTFKHALFNQKAVS